MCATGFDVTHRPSWPLVGRNGVSLTKKWKDEPLAYLSLCVPEFPNYCMDLLKSRARTDILPVMFTGPNAVVGHGSLIAVLGFCADYMLRWIKKMAEEDIKYFTPLVVKISHRG